MAYQAVFQRHELKYLLTRSQKERILECIQPYMSLDKYGRTTIRNIYFDTENYRLIRRSIEKPVYKEKLRVRNYKSKHSDGNVFVEIKKKYNKVVYKRRISLAEDEAISWLTGESECAVESQIVKEIDYFRNFYGELKPALFLSYEREAFYGVSDRGFRVTFDDNILARTENLSLSEGSYGVPLLPEGMILMEIKCEGALPLWMAKLLSEEKMYKTSFSKYGTEYMLILQNKLQGELQNAKLL